MLSRRSKLVASMETIPNRLHFWVEQSNGAVFSLQLGAMIWLASEGHFNVILVVVFCEIVVSTALAWRSSARQNHLTFDEFA